MKRLIQGGVPAHIGKLYFWVFYDHIFLGDSNIKLIEEGKFMVGLVIRICRATSTRSAALEGSISTCSTIKGSQNTRH